MGSFAFLLGEGTPGDGFLGWITILLSYQGLSLNSCYDSMELIFRQLSNSVFC